MRSVLRLWLLLAVLALPGAATADTIEGAPAIRDVITRQMAAFQRDDGQEAFSYAAPGIRQMFRTPENFMTMVREGYAAVYRPAEVDFRAIIMEDGAPVQQVYVVGPDGRGYVAHYAMQLMPDGSWKIRAVWIERVPEVSA